MANIEFIPNYESYATILTNNLLYGLDSVTKDQSRKELIRLVSKLDSFSKKRAMQYLEETKTVGEMVVDSLIQTKGTVDLNVNDDEWDCQP